MASRTVPLDLTQPPPAADAPPAEQPAPEPERRPKSRLAQIIWNALSVLGSDIANRASSFALYFLVARFLGEVSLGQISLAQATFYFVGYSLAGLGIRWFIARELPRNPEKTDTFLVNGTVLVMFTSALAWIAFYIITMFTGYEETTRSAILLMAVTIVPYTMIMVLEGTFIGREKMHFIFLVNAPINVLNIIAIFIVLQAGGGLFEVILIQVSAYSLIALIEWFLMLRFVTRPPLRIRVSEMRTIVGSTLGFYGIDAVIALASTTQTFILSLVVTEGQLGLYSAAGQLYAPTLLILSSVISSMLPVLTRQVEPGFQKLKISAERLIELLLWLSIPAVVGLIIVARDLLLFLYAREVYTGASIFLQIIVLGLLFRGTISVLGNMLYATGNERQNLRIVSVMSVYNLILSIGAILLYGGIGAAVISVVLTLTDLYFHYQAVRRVLRLRINLPPLFLRGLLASVPMALVLLAIPDVHVLLRIAVGAAVYGVALSILLLVTVGKPSAVRERYLSKPSDVVAAQAMRLRPLAEGD